MRELLNRISRVVRWGRITKAGSDDQQFAVQQMSYLGKVADGLIVFPYGIHGNVPADALALMFSVQGNPDNRAAIAWTPKDRPKLAAGEVAFYHPPTDSLAIWRADGTLEITTKADIKAACANLEAVASGGATITAGTINLDVGGGTVNIIAGSILHNGKEIGKDHGHTQAADSNGDTEQPISGVT